MSCGNFNPLSESSDSARSVSRRGDETSSRPFGELMEGSCRRKPPFGEAEGLSTTLRGCAKRWLIAPCQGQRPLRESARIPLKKDWQPPGEGTSVHFPGGFFCGVNFCSPDRWSGARATGPGYILRCGVFWVGTRCACPRTRAARPNRGCFLRN